MIIALKQYRAIRDLQKYPLLIRIWRKFEATDVLSIVHGRRRKPVPVETQQSFELAVEEITMKNTHGSCSIIGVLRQMILPFSTVQKSFVKCCITLLTNQMYSEFSIYSSCWNESFFSAILCTNGDW